MTAHVLAFGSGKGGVGKTTAAVNVACSLALGSAYRRGRARKVEHRPEGRRVLVVDMDRQQSAGDSLGVRGAADETTYAMAIAGRPIDLASTIHQAPLALARGRLDVMPVTPYDYELAAANLVNYPDSGLQVVSTMLRAVADDYDYIVLDLRPELSHFASSAMMATALQGPSDGQSNGGVVVPVTSEATTAVHLAEVQEHIDYLTRASGQQVRTLGVVRGRWDPKSEEGRLVDQLLQGGVMPVFLTAIPAHKIVSKSFVMSTGPVVLSYPKSPATQRFHELTAEISHACEGSR